MSAGDAIAGRTLTLYASVPMNGALQVEAHTVLSGATLALQQIQGRIGKYHIVLKALDDSTVQRGAWDPGQTTANARIAVADKTTIGYLGDLDSGASAIPIPLLNRAGILQISSASTAGVARSGADCVPISALTESDAVLLTTQIAATLADLPHAQPPQRARPVQRRSQRGHDT